MFDLLFDFSLLTEVVTMTPWDSFWYVFLHGGWLIILVGLLWGTWMYWNFYILNTWQDNVKFILLAIDVPRNNEQGPLAVENIFSHLAGAHGTETLYERYWEGKSQLSFSLEIVSINGYVQFVIRTPEKYRDLVEAAVYAQYPDAEMTEIEDYVSSAPQRWPDREHKFFGLEYKLHKPDVYPIRTWLEFEDKLSGEFKDPMAALLEIMGKIGPGEQIWVQLIITPIDDKWKEKGEKLVNKLISRKEKTKETIFGMVLDVPFAILSVISDLLFGAGEQSSKKSNEDPPTMMLHLSPGEKDVVAAIQHKMSKIGFRVKFRIMYVARNEVYHVQRGAHAVVGATKQFNSVELNRFAVQKKIWTKVYYMFTKHRLKERQNKLMRAYRVRSDARGAGPGSILNIEELASLWHFPVMQVKAPLVKKTEAKRAEPPFHLPVVPRRAPTAPPPDREPPASPNASSPKAPPDNLPII